MKYHKELGIPQDIKVKTKALIQILNCVNVTISNHAKEALRSEKDVAGINNALENYTLVYGDVFEIVDIGYIEKLAFRIAFNEEKDIIFVISNNGIIITLWTNNKEDKHFTLNKMAYA